MRISDWSSDVCSADLLSLLGGTRLGKSRPKKRRGGGTRGRPCHGRFIMRPFARRLSTVISATSALGLVAFAPAAFAQEDPGASSDDAGEIIVTARRRDERLVDVPIAVTALSGDTLAKAGAIHLTHVPNIPPNTTPNNPPPH